MVKDLGFPNGFIFIVLKREVLSVLLVSWFIEGAQIFLILKTLELFEFYTYVVG